MEGVTSNKRKMKELEDNLLFRLTSTQVSFNLDLRTFAPKSSHGEIFFISRLELVDKVLTPKMKKKNGGHRLCFGENGSGKMP